MHVRFIPARAGNSSVSSRFVSTVRFIPARAGNSVRYCHDVLSCAGLPVHPRACGELRLKTDNCGLRFIPARAGNSVPGFGPELRFTVHPRACGELFFFFALLLHLFGSSPRVRGTLCYVIRGHASLGGSSPRVRGTLA